jgi:hypothetical protein
VPRLPGRFRTIRSCQHQLEENDDGRDGRNGDQHSCLGPKAVFFNVGQLAHAKDEVQCHLLSPFPGGRLKWCLLPGRRSSITPLGEIFMSDEIIKELEQRIEELSAKVVALEQALRQKADQQQVNKDLSDLRFAVKNHRL